MLARYGSLAVSLLLVTGASFIAAGFSAGEWYYQAASKPAWSPSAWLFGIAWAFAWLALALAGWQVWMTNHYSRLTALGAWFALVVLAIGWSALLFGIHRPGWAWFEISLLLAVAIYCWLTFRKISRPASSLLIPFLLWIIFLWTWTLSIWTLNGGFPGRFL